MNSGAVEVVDLVLHAGRPEAVECSCLLGCPWGSEILAAPSLRRGVRHRRKCPEIERQPSLVDVARVRLGDDLGG